MVRLAQLGTVGDSWEQFVLPFKVQLILCSEVTIFVDQDLYDALVWVLLKEIVLTVWLVG